ncbi:MAG: hydrolase 76 protein [Bogoriella megaspora]|nr:MAG: hydrolase 76 protein [Bogoriella megaspora]
MLFSTTSTLFLAIAAGVQHVAGLELKIDDDASIRQAAATAAEIMFLYYNNSEATSESGKRGLLNSPYYWWESGAMWGAMLDYWKLTGDTKYMSQTSDALQYQLGNNSDFMMDDQVFDTGNDDQAFWAVNALTAAEYGFPNLPAPHPPWIQVAANVFNDMQARWDTTTCGGGLQWQIFKSNANGQNYKNSISNSGFFQIAARLARFTGNTTYSEWANKVYDWESAIGLIDPQNYNVYDGSDTKINCTEINHVTWSYNVGMTIYGAAMMYDISEGTEKDTWATRVQGFVNASAAFFSYTSNATNIMFENACEQYDTCKTDQFPFKGFLARWLSKTSVLVPSTNATISTWLQASAQGAALSCSGETNSTCGERWYIAGYDGNAGPGQQMSALEVFDSLLINNIPLPLKGSSSSASSSSSTSSTLTTLSTVTSTSSTPASTTSPPATTTASTAATTSVTSGATTTTSTLNMGAIASEIAGAAASGNP